MRKVKNFLNFVNEGMSLSSVKDLCFSAWRNAHPRGKEVNFKSNFYRDFLHDWWNKQSISEGIVVNRDSEDDKFTPIGREEENLQNEINDILDFELELRDVPYSEDHSVEIDPITKEKASKAIIELLKKKGILK